MPKIKLTDAFVRSAKPLSSRTGKLNATEYVDETTKGLSLRVTPAGVKSWTYRYRTRGQQKRLSLGKADFVSLADARQAVKVEIGKVSDGGDPVRDKHLAKAASIENKDLRTVQQVGDWYFQECAAGRHKPNARPKKQSTLDLELYYFSKHILPALGKHELADLARGHVQKFVNGLAKDAADSTARRCRIILHSLYTFAMRNEIVEANPVQFVTIAAQKARDRVLTNAELKTIWQALTPPVAIEGAAISVCVAYSVLLAMVTLQRRGEVTGMRLSEIDRDKRIWTLPGTRTKNHRTHVVPLSDLALELIDAGLSIRTDKNDFVFSSPRVPGKPIEPRAMTRAFGRMKHALGLIDIRPHDMRRTGTTNLTGEHLGFPRFIISKVLNQTDSGGAAAVTAIYDRNDYLPEKRRALDAWAIRLLEIVNDEKRGDNVVPFIL